MMRARECYHAALELVNKPTRVAQAFRIDHNVLASGPVQYAILYRGSTGALLGCICNLLPNRILSSSGRGGGERGRCHGDIIWGLGRLLICSRLLSTGSMLPLLLSHQIAGLYCLHK